MNPVELHSHFNRIAPIPKEEWERLSRLMSPRSLKKGEFFIRSGEAPEHIGVVLSGFVRHFYLDREGAESVKAFRGPGELTAAYSEALQKIPSRTHVQAIADTQLLTLRFTDFEKLCEQHPCWNLFGRRVAELHFIWKEQREYEFLELDATQRYESFCTHYPTLVETLPQYQIASYIGITPVALSRIVSRLKKP